MEYLLKSTAILSLFYLFYKIFLQNETFFKSIRIYFLIGFISAIAIPLIVITKHIVVEPINLSNVNLINASSTVSNPAFDWTQIMIIAYLIGVVFFTLRFLAQLSSLLWYIYKQPKMKKGKYYMIISDKNDTPFSFFNYIVYNPIQFKKSELKQIITHEKIHVNQLHSFDTLLSHLALTLNWFNPFIWQYNKEIQKNLEFIADEFTQNISQEKTKYQHLLLKTISPNYQMALTSNFYNSLIKKRINMLQKNRSNSTMYFKFAFIIPILIVFVFTFNTEVIAQHKKVKTIEVHEDVDVEIITKYFTKSQFENLKNKYANKGITFKFKKLKYNSKNEIVSIDISVKNNKGIQSNLSQNGTESIKPIQIKINNETGEMSLGNLDGLHESNLFFTSNEGSGVHKKIIVKKGDGDHDMVWISNDSTKVHEYKTSNNFIFISDDDLHVGSEKGDHKNVWISKDGDSTKMKRIKIIEIDEDSEGPHKVIIKKGENDKKHNVFVVKSGDKVHSGHSNIMYRNSDGKKPLFIVDGKEVESGKIDDIDANKIEKMEVLKGKSAIEKYDEKGKDGVILITTKK